MVLNGSAALVDRAIKEKFLSILLCKLRPRETLILDRAKKSLARTKIRHPDVVARRWQASTAKASHQNSKAISLAIDGGSRHSSFLASTVTLSRPLLLKCTGAVIEAREIPALRVRKHRSIGYFHAPSPTRIRSKRITR
jgi:hypothetical protein